MRQVVMPLLRCPNPRPRVVEAGATKAMEGTEPVAGRDLEAGTSPEVGMAGTAEDNRVKDDMVDAVSRMVGTVISHIISSYRHHTFRRSHTITHTIDISNNIFRSFRSR